MTTRTPDRIPTPWAPPVPAARRSHPIAWAITIISLVFLAWVGIGIGTALPGENTCPSDSESCYEPSGGDVVRANREGFVIVLGFAAIGAALAVWLVRKDVRAAAAIAGSFLVLTLIGSGFILLVDAMARAFNASV